MTIGRQPCPRPAIASRGAPSQGRPRRSRIITRAAAGPDYSAIFNVALELIKLEQQASSATIRTLPVKARKTLDRIELDLDELAIDPPTATGSEIWPALKVLGTQTLGVWSLGLWRYDADGEKQVS